MTRADTVQWALVTGATSGIGRATAEQLAAHGYALVLVARRRDVLDTEAERLRRRYSVPVQVVAADFSDPAAPAQVDAATRGLPISAAILAAGYGSLGPFATQSLSDEVAMVQVNCSSVVELAGRFMARFTETGRGQLVLFGSIVGYGGVANSSTYAATKNFVQAFAEGLQAEVRGTGINVLCVAPGPTATGFAERARMRMGNAPGPEVVARSIVSSLTRNTTITPGAFTKFLHYSLAMLGRRGRSLVLGQVMRGMAPGAG